MYQVPCSWQVPTPVTVVLLMNIPLLQYTVRAIYDGTYCHPSLCVSSGAILSPLRFSWQEVILLLPRV